MTGMAHDPDLAREAIRRTAIFMVTLAVLIIAPAWSLSYWQGWLYWAVFSALVALLGGYFLKHDPALVARRMHAGPAAESRDRQKTIQTFVSIAMVLTFAFPGLDHAFGWSSVPPWLAVFADALVAVSFWIMYRTFRENSYAASTIVVEERQHVVSSGPYAIVRHPMYSGAVLMLLATPIALGSVWGLAFAALTIAGIVWRLLDEEEFLRASLSGYAEYCERLSWRLVPYLW